MGHRNETAETVSDLTTVSVTSGETETWTGTVTYDITGKDSTCVTADATYQITFQLLVAYDEWYPGRVESISGVATASQEAFIEVRDICAANGSIYDTDIPSNLELIVSGTVFTDGNLYLHFSVDYLNRTPFFTYRFQSYDLPVSDPKEILDFISIIGSADYTNATLIPFEEGTHSGGYDGNGQYRYTVTLTKQ